MQYLTDMGVLLISLLFIAFLVETVVEILKVVIIGERMHSKFLYLLSMLIGIVLAFALKVSLFNSEIQFVYIIGVIICGLVASRGSNYIHNFVGNFPKK